VDLTSDPLFCGSCTTPCDSSGGTIGTCVQGVCTSTCVSGWTACGGVCHYLPFDAQNCGSCGHACPVPSGGVAGCDQGKCTALCPPGTAACGGTCALLGDDPANCGGCGHACGATDVCVSGLCTPRASTVIASGLTGVTSLAFDGASIFFVDGAGVHTVPKPGGPVKDLAGASGKPAGVAVDTTYAYFTQNLGGAVLRVPKDGSSAPALVATATQPQGIVVLGDTVFWVSNISTDESIHQAPAVGGAATVFATVSDGSHIPSGLQQIATDGSSLVVGNEQAIYEVPVLPNGTAGTQVSFPAPGVTGGAGAIAAGGGEFCGFWSGLSGLGYYCSKGGFDLQLGEHPGPFVLPGCGFVFWNQAGAVPVVGTYVVADRDFLAGRRVQHTLTTDSAGPMIAYAQNVYFFNTAGEIRVLPVP
jgi:hypothetical protein